jgi:threonine/homoserine/homoserine lactone efflux protein
MTIEFLLTAFLLSLLPGPGVIYTMSTGVAHGAKAGVLAAGGCVVGALPYLVVAAVGLGAELASNPIFFELVKWAGVAYLVFMGIRTWRDRSHFELSADPRTRSVLQLLASGALVSLLNPKVPIFFYAFLPRFVGADRGEVLPLGLTFIVIALVVYAGYGLLAGLLRHRILARPAVAAWSRRIFASSYTLIAARLAFQTR